MKARLLFALLWVCVVCPSTHAIVAISDILTGTQSPSSNSEVGWRFALDTDLTITHLGVWDADGDGLEQSSTIVRIWTSQTDVLAQVEFTAANPGTLVNGFRYLDIPDVTLLAADGPYTISNNNWFGSGQTWFDADMPTVNDPVVLLGPTQASNPGQFSSVPGSAVGAALLGPNFQYIPEPTSMILLGLGGMALVRRRRRLAG